MRYCSYCGKQIDDHAVICVGCGCRTGVTYVPHTPQPPSVQSAEGDCEAELVNWSKICGIVSFFIGWFALGITAIVLAHMSRDERTGDMSQSAKVGYICGIVSTVLSFALLVVLIIVLITLSL